MLSLLCEGLLGFGADSQEAPMVALVLNQTMAFSLEQATVLVMAAVPRLGWAQLDLLSIVCWYQVRCPFCTLVSLPLTVSYVSSLESLSKDSPLRDDMVWSQFASVQM